MLDKLFNDEFLDFDDFDDLLDKLFSDESLDFDDLLDESLDFNDLLDESFDFDDRLDELFDFDVVIADSVVLFELINPFLLDDFLCFLLDDFLLEFLSSLILVPSFKCFCVCRLCRFSICFSLLLCFLISSLLPVKGFFSLCFFFDFFCLLSINLPLILCSFT